MLLTELTKFSILQILNDLSVDISARIPNVNDGGCLIFAVTVAKHLKALKIKVWLRISDSSINVSPPPQKIHGHVTVQFIYDGKTYQYDANGIKLAQSKDHTFGYFFHPDHLSISDGMNLLQKSDQLSNSTKSEMNAITTIVDKHFVDI